MDPDTKRSLLRGTSTKKTFSFRRVVLLLLSFALLASALALFANNGTSAENDVGDSSLKGIVDSAFQKLKKESKKAEMRKENPVSRWFKEKMEAMNARPEKEAPVGGLSPHELFKQGKILMQKEREEKKQEEAVADSNKEFEDGSGSDFLVSDPSWLYKSFPKKKTEKAVSDIQSVQLQSPEMGSGSGTLEKDDSVEGKLKRIAKGLEETEKELKRIPAEEEIADGEKETPNGDTIYIVHSGVQLMPATTMVPMLLVPQATPCNGTAPPPAPTDPCTGNATNVPAPIQPVMYCEPCACGPCNQQQNAGTWTTASAIGITTSASNTTTTKGPGGCICPKAANAKDLRYFYVTESPQDEPPVHHFIVAGDHDINHIRGAITHVLSHHDFGDDYDTDDAPSRVVNIAGTHEHVLRHMSDINPKEHHVIYKITKAGEEPPPRPPNPHLAVVQSMPDPGDGGEEEEEEQEEYTHTLHIHHVHHLVHHDGKSYLADLSNDFQSPDGQSQRVLQVTHHMIHHGGNQYMARSVDSNEDDNDQLVHIHHVIPHDGAAGFLATQQTHFNPDQDQQLLHVTHHLVAHNSPGIFIAHHTAPVVHHFTTPARPTIVHHVIKVKPKPKPTNPPVDIIHQFIPGDGDELTHLQYAVPDTGKDSDLHAHMNEVLKNVQEGDIPPPSHIVHTQTDYSDDSSRDTHIHHILSPLNFDSSAESLNDALPGHLLHVSTNEDAPSTHVIHVHTPPQRSPPDLTHVMHVHTPDQPPAAHVLHVHGPDTSTSTHIVHIQSHTQEYPQASTNSENRLLDPPTHSEMSVGEGYEDVPFGEH